MFKQRFTDILVSNGLLNACANKEKSTIDHKDQFIASQNLFPHFSFPV